MKMSCPGHYEENISGARFAKLENRGQVAQLVEQRTENPCVGGSIPSLATNCIRHPSESGTVILPVTLKTGRPSRVAGVNTSFPTCLAIASFARVRSSCPATANDSLS